MKAYSSTLHIGRATQMAPRGVMKPQPLSIRPQDIRCDNAPRSFAGMPNEAIGAILLEREKHFGHGHTIEDDMTAPDKHLPDRAIRSLVHAQEDMHFQTANHRHHARRNLARAGAFILAAYDRLRAQENQRELI